MKPLAAASPVFGKISAGFRFHPVPDLMDLAIELYEKDHAYTPAGITAALLSRSAAEAFELSGLSETANPLARHGKVSFGSDWKLEHLVEQIKKDIDNIFGPFPGAEGQS